MSFLQEKLIELNGLRLHTIPTKKYKTNTIVLMLKNELSEETVTKRALLPHILQSATESLPTRKEIRHQLEDLYGANLVVDVQKKGDHHIIVFRMDIANEAFLQDTTPIFEKGIKLLAEILLNPKVENNSFLPTIVESEKRSLKQRIQSVYDDKLRYANMRMTEEMFKGEPFALSVYGKEEEIDQMSEQALYRYYQQLLQEDELDLFVVGDIDEQSVEKIVEKYFLLPQQKTVTPVTSVARDSKEITTENVVFEQQDVKQGKLHLGFRAYTTYNDNDYFALQVFNGLFGGFSHSKLFVNVREKASLAYYAASRYESHKGIIIVMSGIEFGHFDKTVAIIKEQLENMRNGEFTDEELTQTKAMIINQLLETIDIPRASIELLYHNVVANTNRSLETTIERIKEVSKEDVIRVANRIKHDTTYFLKGKEEQ